MLYNESDETNIATFTKEGASWKYYTSFYILAQKGLHTIGALKTNRLLYPSGMKKKLSELFCRIISNREWIWPCDSQKPKVLCVGQARPFSCSVRPGWHWMVSVFPGRTSTDSQYHSVGKVSISVSMCKIQYWFWSVYEISRIDLCIFSNLLIYR